MQSDIAVESLLDTWDFLQHEPVLVAVEGGTAPLPIERLRHATPVYWSRTAYELAFTTLPVFDPAADGSSCLPTDLVGDAEWWYFDLPLRMAADGSDDPLWLASTDNFTFRLGGLLLVTVPAMEARVMGSRTHDLCAVVFGRVILPAGVQSALRGNPLAPLGLVWWHSAEPVSRLQVTPVHIGAGDDDPAVLRMSHDLEQYGVLANAFMHWRRSKLAAVERTAVSRACRRRLAREGTIAPLVITLRAHESAPTLTAAQRQYIHTWLVNPHTRLLADGRVVRVRMHLKGPAGAPLLTHSGRRVAVTK